MEKKEKFPIEKIFDMVSKLSKLSRKEKEKIDEAINERIRKRPFRIAIIGQSGVGKTSTLNAVFGLKEYVSNIAEGTKNIEEHIFPMKDGFNLAIYDMPGLNNDIVKDLEYEKLYQKVLPTCDVICYIMNAHSKDIGEDCRILNEIVIPLCKEKNVIENLIIGVNKVDTIGESISPNDPELQWDVINNIPTEKLKDAIRVKLGVISEQLINEGIVGKDGIDVNRIVFYSAVFHYNLRAFLMSILNTPEGVIWVGTVGMDRIGKWSDLVIK